MAPLKWREVPAPFVCPSAVECVMRALPLNKACGVDRVPAQVYRECATVLAAPFACVLNASLRAASVPAQWKHAFVTPVAKIQQPSAPGEFRPLTAAEIAFV